MNDAPMLAGFWRRCLADTLDALILFAAAWLLAWPVRSYLYTVGESGLWIGLLASLIYTSFLQSSIGKGQSLGKRMMDIQVVTLDGRFASLLASLTRFLVLSFCTYNLILFQGLEYHFPALRQPAAAKINAALVMFVLFSSLLLILFHPLKRTLYDLLAGTIVVRKGRYDAGRLAALMDPRKELTVYFSVAFILVFLLAGWYRFSSENKPMADIRSRTEWMRQIVERSGSLQNVHATELRFQRVGPAASAQETHALIVTGFVPKAFFDDKPGCAKEAQRIAQALANEAPYVMKHYYDQATLKIRTGWNIGLASSYERSDYSLAEESFQSGPAQFANDEFMGDGNDPGILARYRVMEVDPAVASWMDLFRKKDFATLEHQVDEHAKSGGDLEWRGVDSFIGWASDWRDEADLRVTHAALDEWVRRRPRSWLAWTCRGNFLISFAWQARGTGYGNSVSEVATRAYTDRLLSARECLEKAQRLNNHQAFSASQLITVCKGLGLDRPTMERYYRQAVLAAPEHPRTADCRLSYLDPKWYGTLKDVIEFSQLLEPAANRYPLMNLPLVHSFRIVAEAGGHFQETMSKPEVWSQVESHYARIFKAYPTEILYHMELAGQASKVGRYDAARREFDLVGDQWIRNGGYATLRDYNNARAFAYAVQANSLMQTNHREEGLTLMEKSYDYRKDDSWVLRQLAYWNLVLKHPEKAKDYSHAFERLKAAKRI